MRDPDEWDPSDIDWSCSVCGSDLKVWAGGKFHVIVEPCMKCLCDDYDRGFDSGYRTRDEEGCLDPNCPNNSL